MKKLALLMMMVLSQSVFSSEIYLLPTRIGDKMFNDILIFDTTGYRKGELTGSLTVPGVFTAPIINGRMRMTWAGVSYEFSIKAIENGQETMIHYEAGYLHDGNLKMHGSLRSEDGSLVGLIEDMILLKNGI